MQGARDQAAVSDNGASASDSPDVDSSVRQPAQTAEASQEWLDQQPADPDNDRGASDQTATASATAARKQLDAQAERHRLPRGPSGGDDLPTEVHSSCIADLHSLDNDNPRIMSTMCPCLESKLFLSALIMATDASTSARYAEFLLHELISWMHNARAN